MKMNLHKIPGVDKSVCTAEQMRAYNTAHFYVSTNADAEHVAKAVVIEMKRSGSKYDAEAVAAIIRANFDAFRARRFHILTSYDEVGRAFPLPC